MKQKIILLLFSVALFSCSDENVDKTNPSNEITANPETALKSRTDSPVLSEYKKAANQYYFYKDNKDHDQEGINKIILEQAKKLLEEYGEPSPESYDRSQIKSEEDLIIIKAFERFVELGKNK